MPAVAYSKSWLLFVKPHGMKKNLFLLYPIFFASISVALVGNDFNFTVTKPVQRPELSAAISCAPLRDESMSADENEKFIPILPGRGSHSYPVTTKSDSAQLYFDQGFIMYYSYHMTEAVASFKEAAKFDSTCAMAYWGQALAMGPDYNNVHLYKMRSGVPLAVSLMNQYIEKASAKEKDLINAMNRRYHTSDTADKQRTQLNEDYADAMKIVITKYPSDLDIKALYIDAMMLVHPWDFWDNDGTAKPWTPQLVKYCEGILEHDPHHPAGLHYYIHITEGSRKAEVALPTADSIKKIFPGIAHMVHMSSHAYERLGYYVEGVQANEEADRSLARYADLAKGLNLQLHVIHNYAVDIYCALSGAMYKKAVQKAMFMRNGMGFKPTQQGIYPQYLYMFPVLAMVRVGKWQDILNDTLPVQPDWTYAGILSDFAKGMACAKKGDYKQAEKYLAQLRERQKDSILRQRFSPHGPWPYDCSVIAENILAANTAFLQKKYSEAFTAIKKAILAEDSLKYREPKLWMLPARQYLGVFLLTLNKVKEAEKIYREDLVWNPGNGWSLLGLYHSLQAQQKTGELKKIKALYMHSFSEADVFPTASAY